MRRGRALSLDALYSGHWNRLMQDFGMLLVIRGAISIRLGLCSISGANFGIPELGDRWTLLYA